MRTSAAGRALIEQREGRRLAAYRDTKGILTIGVGHTGRMSPPRVTAGMKVTEAQCDVMLAADLAPVEAAIASAIEVPLSQNEFDALVSLGFNIGVGGLHGSSVVRRLNLGDVAGAADSFLMWDRPAALAGRRKAERLQFLTPDAGRNFQAPALAAARAATLSTMAATTKAKARTAQSAAAALVVASATTVATTHAHHAALALFAGGLVLAVGVAAAIIAVRGYASARTLALNAAYHASASGEAGTPSNDLVETLLH